MSRVANNVIITISVFVAGCSSNNNCQSHHGTVCLEGALYWLDSCGKTEEYIKHCSRGCRADGIACQEDALRCDTAADCPPGQGCISFLCGLCATEENCRSGEICNAGICVTRCQGPCCDDHGKLLPASALCNSWEEVRCSGTGCGADPQKRTVTQYCSGISSACDGSVKELNWTPIAQCSTKQLCWNDGTTGGCTDCPVACQEGACVGCSTEPCCKNGQLVGTDTACQSVTEYRCVGVGCGTDIYSRTTTRYCDGINLACLGRTEYTSWTLVQDCADDAVCVSQGNQARCQTCQAGCAEGACQEPCQPGPCCVAGRLSSTDTVCRTGKEYRCEGGVCGADAQERTLTQFCSGASSDCDGTIEHSEWVTIEDCGVDAVCWADEAGAACQECELGCAENGCTPCTSEPCCLDGAYRPASFPCGAWTEYRCSSGDCGADAQQRAVRQYCSGNSFFCNGTVVPDAWLTIENCSPDDICQTDGQTYAECTDCQNGCSDGQCN